jgi:peroxiredoxin
MADHRKFEALDVQILGISASNSFSQRTFADSLRLPFPLLSDFPDLKAIRSFGGVNPNVAVTIAQRWLFLIDREGVVRGQWRGTVEDVFPSEPILKAVQALGRR